MPQLDFGICLTAQFSLNHQFSPYHKIFDFRLIWNLDGFDIYARRIS